MFLRHKVLVIGLCFLPFSIVSYGQDMLFQEPAFSVTSISTQDSEIMAVRLVSRDSLFFLRSPTTKVGKRHSEVWLSERVLNVWRLPQKMEADWNKSDIKGVIGATPGGDTLFLTKQSRKRGWVRIFSSYHQNQQWTDPKFLFKYKRANWRSGAYVSPSEDVIIFPMKGRDSYGKEDLYIVVRDSVGGWTDPANLGATINTDQTERAPFFYRGHLFFASDGHGGFGSLDLVSAKRLYNSWKTWSKSSNLGAEINTSDEEAFISLYGDGEVYFSRGRNGQYDILSAAYSQDAANSIAVGEYEWTDAKEDVRELKKMLHQEKGMIFFGVSSARLAPKFRELLFYVYTVLSTRDDVTVTLIGHADQEGNKKYNQELSRKRAIAVKDYLVSLGMKEERLQTVARGESELLTTNSTDEAKRRNRRVQLVLKRNDITSQARNAD